MKLGVGSNVATVPSMLVAMVDGADSRMVSTSRDEQVVCVAGWVRRGKRVLLVRRRDPTSPALDGAWELPGGKLQFGEAPEAAVAREIREETGYSVSNVSLLPHLYSTVWELADRRRHVVLLVFECWAGRRQRHARDPKVAGIAWQRPAEIDVAKSLPSVGVFLEWWRAWQANLSGMASEGTGEIP